MSDLRVHRNTPEVRRIDRAILRLEAEFDAARTKDDMHGIVRKQQELMEARARYLAGAGKDAT